MSIGRLLAAGKSLAGGHAGGGRYRVNKHVLLPNFGSRKNPFTAIEPAEAPVETATEAAAPAPVMAEPMAPVQSTANVVNLVGDMRRPKLASRLVAGVTRATRAVGVQVVRAARWVGGWGQKLNPLSLLARRRSPFKAVGNDFKQPAVQTELSLDAVQVVRNDLNDADLEVVLVTRPVAPDAKAQLVMASAGGEPRSGGPLNRVTEWVFGPKF